MLSTKEIEEMHIAFDFSRQYTVARVPKKYRDADQFALDCVYSLRPYVADKLNIDCSEVILVAISKSNQVIVFCDDGLIRNRRYESFHQPSIGSAQLYNDIKPELIIKRLDKMFPK